MTQPIDQAHLDSITSKLVVYKQTTDHTDYTIPNGKLLLLNWGIDSSSHLTNVTNVIIQDGAGSNGNQQILELYDGDGDLILDAFFDNCPYSLEKRLKLIDNPFI